MLRCFREEIVRCRDSNTAVTGCDVEVKECAIRCLDQYLEGRLVDRKDVDQENRVRMYNVLVTKALEKKTMP